MSLLKLKMYVSDYIPIKLYLLKTGIRLSFFLTPGTEQAISVEDEILTRSKLLQVGYLVKSQDFALNKRQLTHTFVSWTFQGRRT